MSHFTVMVIGDNPEFQLEPFSEHLEVEKYCKGEVSQEDKDRFMETYTVFEEGRRFGVKNIEEAEKNSKLSFDKLYKKFGIDWNGGSWEKNEDGVWCEYSTYNPNSKWDWYQLGGRWSDKLKIKEGCEGNTGSPSLLMDDFVRKTGWCDQALKKDIDFDGMRKEAEDEALKDYRKIKKIFGGKIPTIEIPWKTIIDPNNPLYNQLDIEEKRNVYHNQTALIEVNKHIDKLGHFFELESYQMSIDDFAKKSGKRSILTFAVLKDGEWYEKGHMGWWAIVSDEKDNWEDVFVRLLEETGDDEYISIYDCHI